MNFTASERKWCTRCPFTFGFYWDVFLLSWHSTLLSISWQKCSWPSACAVENPSCEHITYLFLSRATGSMEPRKALQFQGQRIVHFRLLETRCPRNFLICLVQPLHVKLWSLNIPSSFLRQLTMCLFSVPDVSNAVHQLTSSGKKRETHLGVKVYVKCWPNANVSESKRNVVPPPSASTRLEGIVDAWANGVSFMAEEENMVQNQDEPYASQTKPSVYFIIPKSRLYVCFFSNEPVHWWIVFCNHFHKTLIKIFFFFF